MRLNVSTKCSLAPFSSFSKISNAAADPEYGMAKGLKDVKGKTKRKVNLKCKVDNPEAKVKWYHNGKEVPKSDPRYESGLYVRILHVSGS